MLCAYTRPRYQVSIYRTIGPLVIHWINRTQVYVALCEFLKSQIILLARSYKGKEGKHAASTSCTRSDIASSIQAKAI